MCLSCFCVYFQHDSCVLSYIISDCNFLANDAVAIFSLFEPTFEHHTLSFSSFEMHSFMAHQGPLIAANKRVDVAPRALGYTFALCTYKFLEVPD